MRRVLAAVFKDILFVIEVFNVVVVHSNCDVGLSNYLDRPLP